MSRWLDLDDLDGAWDRLEPEDRNLVMLWRAVIAQAIRDMVSIDVDVALEAATWLGTEDYREVCELALLDGEGLEIMIRSNMADDNPLYRKGAMNQLSDQINTYAGQEPLDDAA